VEGGCHLQRQQQQRGNCTCQLLPTTQG
jgi:hypothetical protein